MVSFNSCTSSAVAYTRTLPRVTMVCLLIAHGIFPRQEASQSRRAIMKSPQPAATHLGRARSGSVFSTSGQVPASQPAPSRVCEAGAQTSRTIEAETPLEIGFLLPHHHRAVDCLISLISHTGPHLPLVIHTSTALHHHSLWCFATSPSFHCTRARRHSFRHPSLTYHSLSSATSTPRRVNDRSILPPLAPGQQPFYTFNPAAWLPDACARHRFHLIPPNHSVFFTAKLRSQLPCLAHS
jgi:hypothetical protein